MAFAAPWCIDEWRWHGKCPRQRRIYGILHVVDKYPSAICADALSVYRGRRERPGIVHRLDIETSGALRE